ncbi:hypothetical protein [Marinifilum caeruleilacunae]|uniref:Uncharacterized protein n=1 Tax=Marinifilum caeruleilacunae TaxID=2499076 RepID=A0ABX1WZF4_9BACT|nr:hypothetical protein [Marinifilum caeruleilacunae]NOU61412.1 hypothetical protein [Marinifilum caeruleilacunae]
MKTVIALCVLMFFSFSLLAQSATDDDYLEKWKMYKEQKAPFNQDVEKEKFLSEIVEKKPVLQLGDLRFKKKEHSFGHDVLSVAWWAATVVDENIRYQNSIHKNPARFFAVGYQEQNY